MPLTMQENSVLIRFGAFCVGSTLLYLVGVKDDLVSVGYKTKFAIQILSGSFFIAKWPLVPFIRRNKSAGFHSNIHRYSSDRIFMRIYNKCYQSD